jgi:hypothetical protein
VCSDAYIAWIESRFCGIYRGKDLYNDWLFYAARDRFPSDVPRQQALRFMLIVAVSPATIPRDWRDQLRQHGWRSAQARSPIDLSMLLSLVGDRHAAGPLARSFACVC